MTLYSNIRYLSVHQWVLALMMILLPTFSLADAQSLVILVRHAEKAKSEISSDPTLSTQGVERAQQLLKTLEHTQISKIISTPLKRTLLTAKPVSDFFNIEPTLISVENGVSHHIQAVINAVNSTQEGDILIVGHSNTIPQIIRALGGPKFDNLCEADYDNLFFLINAKSSINEPSAEQGRRFIHARYGALDENNPC